MPLVDLCAPADLHYLFLLDVGDSSLLRDPVPAHLAAPPRRALRGGGEDRAEVRRTREGRCSSSSSRWRPCRARRRDVFFQKSCPVDAVATTGAEKGWGGGGDGRRQARAALWWPAAATARGPASSFPGGNDARSGAPRPPPRRQPRHPPPRWLRRYGARGNYRARGRRRNCGERGRAGSELLVDWGRRAVQRAAGRLLRLGERDRGVASRGDEKAVCRAIWGVICKSSIVETGQETGVVRALILLDRSVSLNYSLVTNHVARLGTRRQYLFFKKKQLPSPVSNRPILS